MELTEQIMNIIVAVQAYRRFRHSDLIARNTTIDDFDLYYETFDYYKSFDLPEGMKANKACFEAVRSYPVAATIDTPVEELPMKFKFCY